MTHRLTNTLQIGDLALEIEGPTRWIEWLGQRWPGWMGDTATESWRLSVRTSAATPVARSPFPVQPRFADGVCHLTGPGFRGIIDPGQASAHLEAHPRAGAGDLVIFVRACLALQAFEWGGVLFHAAGVVHRGRGYALFGLSGSGKTTAARLSAGDSVLNDDLILVKPGEAGWEMWATPFGAGCPPKRGLAPLHVLLHLVQSREDKLEALGPGAALGELVANSPVVNANPARVPALLSRWQEVGTEVPVLALYFRKSPTFWEVVDAEFG